MTTVGPICHIPPSGPTGPNTQPGPVSLPNIPVAEPNLASLTAAVNALRQVVMYLTGHKTLNNGGGGFNRRAGGGGGDKGGNDKNNKQGRWIEDSRVETKVKIYQNNDKTSPNWVEVNQINKLVMKDTVTGEKWNWIRGQGQPGNTND